ncbi:MAG: cobalt ECF transporter T component CbiQ [Chloroflexi bacterium]|nr:cobalt ECF transporter T component CbiQ [Chloroflexota bacterium]
MHVIDRLAYSNHVRAVSPGQKAGTAFSVLVLCLVLDRPAVGLLAAFSMWALATFWAGIPGRVFGRLLLAEGVFLSVAVVGVAVNVTTTATVRDGWGWALGSLWIGANQVSVETAARLVTRALGGVAAMNFLALTTPMVDVIDSLRRLHVPGLLIDLMTLVYRFVFALLDSLTRIYTAQDSRLGYASFRRGMASAAALATQLFVDTYQRSLRLQNALESRGYHLELRVLPLQHRRDLVLFGYAIAIAGSMFIVGMLT